MYTVAVDIGGTFTDVVVMDDASGRTFAGKALTTPDDLQRGVFDSLADAAGEVGTDVRNLLGRTGRMVHATTQSSNAVFAFSGAKTAVLATRGFGDTLLIMRATGRVAGLSRVRAPSLPHDAEAAPPRGRARHLRGPRAHRLPGSRGAAARRCRAWSTSRAAFAMRATRLSRSRSCSRTRTRCTSARCARSWRGSCPGVYLSLSSEVAPVMGEYERSATALFNAYVGPVIESYVSRLAAALRDAGLRQQLLMMQANGGVATTAQTVPIFTIESGPAAGVVGAARDREVGVAAEHHRHRRRRHHVQGRDHRAGPLGLQPRDRAEPVPAAPADGRRRVDRRGRRLDRVGGRPSPAHRPAERRGRARDPHATASAATSRPSPTPTSCSATSPPIVFSAAA